MISFLKRLWHCQECDEKESLYEVVSGVNSKLRIENFKMVENREQLHDLCIDLMNFINESSNSKKSKGANHKIKVFKETQRKLDEDWQKIFEKENNRSDFTFNDKGAVPSSGIAARVIKSKRE